MKTLTENLRQYMNLINEGEVVDFDTAWGHKNRSNQEKYDDAFMRQDTDRFLNYAKSLGKSNFEYPVDRPITLLDKFIKAGNCSETLDKFMTTIWLHSFRNDTDDPFVQLNHQKQILNDPTFKRLSDILKEMCGFDIFADLREWIEDEENEIRDDLHTMDDEDDE